jgi:GAF domain-containing protein
VDKRFYPQKADLASGLVEIQPGFWSLLDRQTLVSVAQEHARRALGVSYSVFFLPVSDGIFASVAHEEAPQAETSRLELSPQQMDELHQKRVIANTNGGAAAGYVPIHVDRGRTTELLGLLAIGTRDDGRGYSGDDLKGLVDLGGKIGLALRAVELGESRR